MSGLRRNFGCTEVVHRNSVGPPHVRQFVWKGSGTYFLIMKLKDSAQQVELSWSMRINYCMYLHFVMLPDSQLLAYESLNFDVLLAMHMSERGISSPVISVGTSMMNQCIERTQLVIRLLNDGPSSVKNPEITSPTGVRTTRQSLSVLPKSTFQQQVWKQPYAAIHFACLCHLRQLSSTHAKQKPAGINHEDEIDYVHMIPL